MFKIRLLKLQSIYYCLSFKSTGMRPLGRPRHKWEDNITMDLKEISINMRNWIDLAHDRDYCPCECDTEPLGSMSH